MAFEFKEDEVTIIDQDLVEEVSPMDITFGDMDKYLVGLYRDFEPEYISEGSKVFNSFCYQMAVYDKISFTNKIFCRAFIEHQFQVVKDPQDWLVKIATFADEADKNGRYTDSRGTIEVDCRNFLSVADEILRNPEGIFNKIYSEERGLRIYLTVEELKIFNALLYQTGVIKENKKTWWERILSKNLISKNKEGLISFKSLSKNRMQYETNSINNVRKILNKMINELNKF